MKAHIVSIHSTRHVSLEKSPVEMVNVHESWGFTLCLSTAGHDCDTFSFRREAWFWESVVVILGFPYAMQCHQGHPRECLLMDVGAVCLSVGQAVAQSLFV